MKRTIQSILFLAILIVSAQSAYSCSCFRIDNETEINDTDFIFVGKVVEIIKDKTYAPPKVEGAAEFIQKMIDTRKRYLVKFKIEKKFKGVETREITLVKYEQANLMCAGLSFKMKKTYLVYADENEERKEISDNGLCSRTQSFDETSKDYKELLNLNNKRIKQKKS